jgi:hypothetical protein
MAPAFDIPKDRKYPTITTCAAFSEFNAHKGWTTTIFRSPGLCVRLLYACKRNWQYLAGGELILVCVLSHSLCSAISYPTRSRKGMASELLSYCEPLRIQFQSSNMRERWVDSPRGHILNFMNLIHIAANVTGNYRIDIIGN